MDKYDEQKYILLPGMRFLSCQNYSTVPKIKKNRQIKKLL